MRRSFVVLRWAIADLPTRLSCGGLRWRNSAGDCGSPELYRTRREARAVAQAHNANPAWGWRQRAVLVRVVIEEVAP